MLMLKHGIDKMTPREIRSLDMDNTRGEVRCIICDAALHPALAASGSHVVPVAAGDTQYKDGSFKIGVCAQCDRGE